jgi:hypothetical protein
LVKKPIVQRGPFRLRREAASESPIFRHFLELARSLQFLVHAAGSAGANTGRHKMINFATSQQLIASILGALCASLISISAAVGPATHLI